MIYFPCYTELSESASPRIYYVWSAESLAINIVGDYWFGLFALAGVEFEDHAEKHAVELSGGIFETGLELVFAVVVGFAVAHGDSEQVDAVGEHVGEPAQLVAFAEWDGFVFGDAA